MRRFPLTIWEVLVAFFKAYFVLSREETSRDRADLEQWGCRHLGKAAVDYLLSPFLTGIYAAKPSEICVGAAFPALEIPAGHSLISAQLRKFRAQRSTQKKLKSSARKERKAMMVPRQGMGALVFALEKRLEQRLGERFRKNEKVLSIPDAANVILATPAAQASALLASIDPVLSKALSKIRYVPLICATLFVPKEAFSSSPAGVGVLVPESEKRGCLGVLFNSSAFPGRVIDESQWISLSMMLGGTVYPEVLDRSDEELLTLIRGELRALFGLSESAAQSSRIFIRRWPRAIPMYNSDVMEAWEAARAGWCASPGRVLAGNYTGQVSIRGMIQDAYALGSELPAELNTPRSI
jgi:oxygen-dependent protoporphyrinogen oxidase